MGAFLQEFGIYLTRLILLNLTEFSDP